MLSNIRNQYEITGELGAGGMGKVYQAKDSKLGRPVAIKVLSGDHRAGPEMRKRFFQEARAASALNHPNIITIHDIVSEGDFDAIVMELVSGKTLADTIPQGGLRVPQALDYSLQIADALAAAHNAGIVHRDLKPGNVMITDRGHVKMLDFGLAKLEAGGSATTDSDVTRTALTVEGSILGTVAYMSPEQAQGKVVDRRSDIFSFGAVLYETLTGKRAFPGENAVTTLTAVLRDDPRPIASLAPDVPPQFAELVAKCLRKDPDQRWQSMDEVRAELAQLKSSSDSGVLYRPVSGIAAPAAAQRSKAPLFVAGALAALLGVGGFLWMNRAPEPPPEVKSEAPVPVVEPKETGLDNADVIKMAKAKVPESLILSQIKSGKTAFDLSPEKVIELVQSGVSERVIEFMRDPSRPLPAGMQKPPATQTSAPAPVPAAGAPAPVTPAPPAPGLPPPPPLTAGSPQAPASLPSSVAPTSTPGAAPDGTPIPLMLADDVPEDVDEGATVRFTVAADVKVGNRVVVATGAAARGEVMREGRKRRFGPDSHILFRFVDVQGVNGPVKIRSTPAARPDGSPRQLDVPGKHGRGIAAPRGTLYPAYAAQP